MLTYLANAQLFTFVDISSLTVYTVGGAVRDQLLNIKAKDHDFVVVGATPEQMLSLGFEQVGRDFPVFLHPKTKQEYALARTERKQGSGYTGFVCYAAPDVTLEQDLRRRDLTINAMAQDSKGNIIDPYGGQQDIANKILRHVSSAFAEDPLRVLRVARFAARFAHLGFTIADETLALMQQLAASGELEQLTAERVWQEMQRALTEQSPWVFFETLRACNALKVLWPSLDVLWGIPNPAQWHPEVCSGIHTMMVLQQACLLSSDAKVRFAAVCHDLGKGVTPVEQYPHHRGHETAGLPLVTAICQQYKVPNHYQSLALKVCQYHLHVHKAFELKPSTILKMFNKLDLWRKADEFELFLLCCTADAKGRLGKEHEPYLQATWLQQCAQACLQITAKPFVEQGLQGKGIKQAMELARLNAIKQLKCT